MTIAQGKRIDVPAVDHAELLSRVERWGALTRRRDAVRALAATLRALREGLLEDEAALLARDLPPRLARIVRDGSHTGHLTLPQFYRRVAGHERLGPGFPVEHAQAACEALASLLPEPTVRRLRMALPAIAELFIVRDRRPQIPADEDS
jgi:uncharacterized protein (DUF2267 family)